MSADPALKSDLVASALDQWRLDVIRAAEAAAERKVNELLSKQAAERQLKLYSTEEAAEILRITPGALRKLVARRSIVPDSRGQRGNGLKGNRFSMETIRAFVRRR